MPHPSADDAAVERFREAVTVTLGLRLGETRAGQLDALLHERLRATRARDLEAYVASLAHSLSEQGELARRLVVPETSFLRNADHFRALEAELRARARSAGRPLRLLSAGCSSGEEPYSLALLVRELGAELLAPSSVEIVGIDLNPDALRAARAARYSAWSLRAVPEPLRRRYFVHQPDGSYHLVDALRSMVRFEQRNLLADDPAFWRAGAFDLVLCRNALMYLEPGATRAVLGRIAHALVPGGLLFLGHAESLRGVSRDFHLVHEHATFYYARKGEHSGEAAAVTAVTAAAAVSGSEPGEAGSWSSAIAASSQRLDALVREHESAHEGEREGARARAEEASAALLEEARSLMQRERFAEALERLDGLSAEAAAEPEAMLLRAGVQLHCGDTVAAEQTCRALLAVDELHARAHHLVALCREQAGDLAAAAEHDAIASHLDPGFAMPHLHRGLMARRSGELELARDELEQAIALLEREESSRIAFFGGGFGREGLVRLCRAELAACARRR